jgi:hypothetical protein
MGYTWNQVEFMAQGIVLWKAVEDSPYLRNITGKIN